MYIEQTGAAHKQHRLTKADDNEMQNFASDIVQNVDNVSFRDRTKMLDQKRVSRNDVPVCEAGIYEAQAGAGNETIN